jgi:hypothetical protein
MAERLGNSSTDNSDCSCSNKKLKMKTFRNEITLYKVLIFFGMTLLAIISWASIDSHFTDLEYPMLTVNDSLKNERISTFKTNHGLSLVTFSSGRKYQITSSKNFTYDDFQTITSVLHIGDFVNKGANSDSISFTHKGATYLFVLGKMIHKNQ